MDKTIKCLKTKQQTYIREQERYYPFYSDLFMNQDDMLKNISLSSLQSTSQQIQNISEKDDKGIEGYLTVEELSNALRNAKNNKALD